METNKFIPLAKKSLQEINGGCQKSYDIGYQIGDALSKAFTAIGIICLFL